MPNNGVAVRLAPEPTPASPSTQEDIRTTIGAAVASAATAICRGVAEYQCAGLSNETRLAGGERIAALYTLQQAHAGTLNFPIVARAEGARALRHYLDADSDFRQSHGPHAGEGTINVFVDEVLGILDRVTKFERAFAN